MPVLGNNAMNVSSHVKMGCFEIKQVFTMDMSVGIPLL